jgi:hypothetical protein
MIAVPDNLLLQPHIQKVINAYKHQYNQNSYGGLFVKSIKTELNYYEVLDGTEAYKRGKVKEFLYKITNFFGLTNKNLELVEFNISNMRNWLYYPTLDAKPAEIGIKRYEYEYRECNWTKRPEFNFSIPEALSEMHNIPIITRQMVIEAVNKALHINKGQMTLYVRDVEVDGKLCVIKFIFDIVSYETNYVPVEDDITKLGQEKLMNFLSNVKNHAMLTKINSIENGKVNIAKDGTETYVLDEYIPSIEEMIMFSDFALKQNGIELKSFFKKKLENYERTELQAFYDKSQLLNYIDPKTIFNEAAADKEDEIKPKAVKTRVRKKKEEVKKETADEKVIKDTKVKVRKTTTKTTKTTKKKDDEKEKKTSTRKTAAKKKKEN